MWVLGLFSESGYSTWMRSTIVSPRTEKQFKVCRPKVWLYMTCCDSCGNQVPPTIRTTTTTTTTSSTYAISLSKHHPDHSIQERKTCPSFSRWSHGAVFSPGASIFHRWGLIGMTQKKHISGFEGLVWLKRSMYQYIHWASTTIKIMVDPISMIKTLR